MTHADLPRRVLSPRQWFAPRGITILLVALSLTDCSRRFTPVWRPDPRVAHTDTAFQSGGVRIAVERIALRRRGRHPAILVLHPSDGTAGSGGQYVRKYAEQLALHGYVAYVVHYFDRTGIQRSDDTIEDENFPIWTETLRDAVSFAQGDRSVDAKRIGAFGFSLGGYMALSLGASDPRVGGLVVLSGGFFDALAPTVRRLPPTLLIHGGEDDVVPLAAAQRVDSTLASLGVRHELVVYAGAGHGFGDGHDPDASARTVRFFDGAWRDPGPSASR